MATGLSERVTTTTEWWDVDGVPLETHAWNLSSWGGSRQSVPVMRGADEVLPGRSGKRWRPKQPDSRTIELSGWVIGADLYGTPVDQQRFRENWSVLKRLLWNPDREVLLTRRWIENGQLMAATGRAQFSAGLSPQMTGPTRATWAAQMVMADPFFYSAPVKIDLAPNAVTSAIIPGDYASERMLIRSDLGYGQINLTQTTTDPDVAFSISIPQATPAALNVDVHEFTMTGTTSGGSTIRLNSTMSHSGSPLMFSVPPGIASIARSGSFGSAVWLEYQPAWL